MDKLVHYGIQNMKAALWLSCLFATTAFAGIDKVTSTTVQPLKTPSSSIPAEALLDVAIPPFNDGLDLTDDKDTVFPEVRYAEAIYFSNQLAKIMERSGEIGRASCRERV